MYSLSSLLPKPIFESQTSPSEDCQANVGVMTSIVDSSQSAVSATPPCYGKRKNFVPRKQEDFMDGGAYPECHYAQFPLDLGRNCGIQNGGRRVSQIDDNQNSHFIQTLQMLHTNNNNNNNGADNVVGGKETIVGGVLAYDEEVVEKHSKKTMDALEELSSSQHNSASKSEFIRFSSGNGAIVGSLSGLKGNGAGGERIVRMSEMQRDPLEPSKFRQKKLPYRPPSPPVPVLQSAPEKLTKDEVDQWKIPPCISSWKNPKGYTIPLDKRLATDGRNLLEVQINDSHAKLAEALYAVERISREEIEKKIQLQKMIAQKEKEVKEEKLKELAQMAREERSRKFIEQPTTTAAGRDSRRSQTSSSDRHAEETTGHSHHDVQEINKRHPDADDKDDRWRRRRPSDEDETVNFGEGSNNSVSSAVEELRKETRRELREAERRKRDSDRDVTEKIALGQKIGTKNEGSEADVLDSRLFNQAADDDRGNFRIFDRPLFSHSSASSSLYRPRASTSDTDYNKEKNNRERMDNFQRHHDNDSSPNHRGSLMKDRPVNDSRQHQQEEEEDYDSDGRVGRRRNGDSSSSSRRHTSGGPVQFERDMTITKSADAAAALDDKRKPEQHGDKEPGGDDRNRVEEDDDPFGFNKFLTSTNTRKRGLDPDVEPSGSSNSSNIRNVHGGGGGFLAANAGSGYSGGSDNSSRRKRRIEFDDGSTKNRR